MTENTFCIHFLGCKVNQYESQVLRENLEKMGYSEADGDLAGLVIINSCTVTHQADAKTRRLIRRSRRDNPSARIFVTGCSCVRDEDVEVLRSMQEVDEVVPNCDKLKIPLMLGGAESIRCGDNKASEQITWFDSHTRAFVKVQDGCSRNCSYCKVRLVRGPSRSREKAHVLDEVSRLVEVGYKEIVLTGICLGSWRGADGEKLPGLIREVCGLKGDFRIRLSSIEPDQIDDGLIEAVLENSRLCRHLHIPLQSGSDRVLERMCRKYDSVSFREIIDNIRSKMPATGITMDVIAGFPKETEEEFGETLMLIKEIRPSRLHVFGYSDRKGTPAYEMDGKVGSDTVKRRVEELIKVGDELRSDFCREFIGREVEVLVEKDSSAEGILSGYTSEYIKVDLHGFKGLEEHIVRLKASEYNSENISLSAHRTDIIS